MNHVTTYKNKKRLTPEKIFKEIQNNLRHSYLYDDSSDNSLLVMNGARQPQFQVYIESDSVSVSVINPILMDLNEEKDFKNLIQEILN